MVLTQQSLGTTDAVSKPFFPFSGVDSSTSETAVQAKKKSKNNASTHQRQGHF
jgi:hypothetical protein